MGNACMFYCRRKECGWNDTHTSGFYAAWKRDPGTFSLTTDHDYWKLSGKTVGVATSIGSSEGGGAVNKYQCRLALSEDISRHQGEATDATFSSSLADFSKLLDN